MSPEFSGDIKMAVHPKPNSSPPRYEKLDGKPRSRPRGRHAVARSDLSDEEDDAARRKVTPLPVNRRLGYRVIEFAALTGTNPVTIWRGIKSGKIKTVTMNDGITIIPRAFAIELGLITADDTL